MAESVCSCCKLLGKPPARINFIISTGLPYGLIHERIEYLLENYSETSSFENGDRLTNYETLVDISRQFFGGQKVLSTGGQSISTEKQSCCHGFETMTLDIDDIADSFPLDTFKKTILDLLDRKDDSESQEENTKPKSPTWIMINDSMCLEPAFLNIFIQLNNQDSSLFKFTLNILCFLVDEQRLFENWFFQNLPIEDYNKNIAPTYERKIKNFFHLLNSSKYLQQNTLLINEQYMVTDDKLQILLQGIFQHGSSKSRANNERFRQEMSKLFSFHQRRTHDIRNVRSTLQKRYNRTVKDRLMPLLNDLQQTTKAADAARKIIHIVLNEFERMDDEERRVYKRQLILGFQFGNAKDSNTIVAQLIHYALSLLKNNDGTLVPFIYSIIAVICRLGTHFIFRHELLNNTPEIFTLSLLLVSQRQYALTLAGLRLCMTILDGDQNEHKYAMTYLKHDPLSARKILDAIKWLLSPYLTLDKMWQEEEEDKEKDSDASESDKEQSALFIAEKCSVRHAGILTERSYIRGLTSLFYGSADHCAQVTEDDVHQLGEVIHILADSRISCWTRSENKSRTSLMLLTDICAFLTPILLHGLPSVCLTLLNKDHLLTSIPKAISSLLKTENADKMMTNICMRFYTQFVQSKCKQTKFNNDTDNEQYIELSDIKPTEENIDPPSVLTLSRDLISSYFDLYRQVQKTSNFDEKSSQQEQMQRLLNDEWKKLDTLQLQLHNEQLKHKHISLQEELSKLRDELQRTQLEKDQFRTENTRMAQEIDRLKLMPTTGITTVSQQSASLVSTNNNNNNQENKVDELKDLSPHEITREQAEQCIKEIYHRRTTFNDHDMRKSICGSLKHLGSDLYSSPVHFLHELIQNAEDNFYNDTVIPCLRIELNHDYILLSNNERGLRSPDVLAICSLAVSTKTMQQELLGEKGVGFKSVFAATNQPMLFSHAWKFRFQVPGEDHMSYITPLWITDQDIPECISNQLTTYSQDTHLYLPLKLQISTPEAELFLNQVIVAADPCILLNMRHLKKLEIIDKRDNKVKIIEKQSIGSTELQGQSNVTFENFSFINLSGSIIKLCTSSGYNTFRVYTCYIDIPNSIEQRRSPQTRLILAFPCENDSSLTSTVYTGLPVCDLGFNFLFNADFQLVTNRENVRENVPFNTFIRDHIATLFVYLLLNDLDLRKDFNRYCPSKNIRQLKHSSWWLAMVDNIDKLMNDYVSVLLNIQNGKTSRYFNKDLASLVSNEQLYNCADIQVIDLETSYLTAERLKSFQIQPVSIMDVLNCFPNRNETTETNEFRQQFWLWSQDQDEQWWSQLFHHIIQSMASEISRIMLEKPIFLLKNVQQRQYLPMSDGISSHLFISDDPSIPMWKRQLTLLQYSSESEKTALLKSNDVQLLTEERMIEIIRHDHLQLAISSVGTNTDIKIIEEVWKDLIYLRSHLDKLDKSTPFLVPVSGTSNLAIIQKAMVPTILGVDIRLFMNATTFPTISFPYQNVRSHQLIDILEWERFLLEMNCQRPQIYLPSKYDINKLPPLPSFSMLIDENGARLGTMILSAHREETKDCFRQFPVIADLNIEQQIVPVSATFDKTIVRDLPSLPRITIPLYCRALAVDLGVHVQCDLRTCVTVLQLLSDEKNTNVDLYIQWLGYLQLYVRQQPDDFNSENLLSSCQLYLPDQQNFYSLKDLLVIPDNEEHRNSVLLVSKYLKLQLITPSINQIYWQLKDLFRLLGCKCTVTIDHVYKTIDRASRDTINFFALGDCKTTLTENGMETIIILFQYLEDLILKCVKDNHANKDLYHAIIEKRHPKAPCGSREDLEWRFTFTCNSLSQELKKLTGIQFQENKIGLLTIDQRLITKTTSNIVYACLETKIIQNLSKHIGKRYFISPSIARTCPLVLAIFDIDYVERRSIIQWRHKNHNLENHLQQLTDIFCYILDDPELEVITAKYASVAVLLSDSPILNLANAQDDSEVVRYAIDSDYPFWIFNKTILFCAGFEKDDASLAIIATSALTTLLHKRKHIPFEESKSIAQQAISQCTAFRSTNVASVASAEPNIYLYTDLLFPTDHHTIESMTISLGNYRTTERDSEEHLITSTVAANRIAEDEVYRIRVQTQNHTRWNNNSTKNWGDPSIVDGLEKIRIGQKAEHFFFVYLQHLYGSVDVTPTKNWRSSARLVIYPQYRRNVDDSVGYDFELHDTREFFARSSKSTTKTCYFEVKGTSGSFNEAHSRFHISHNELATCEAIAYDTARLENEAYFIVIVENCLDPEKVSLGTIINWSESFDRIQGTPESYQCNIIPPSSMNYSYSNIENEYYNNNNQQWQQQQPSVRSNDRNNYYTTGPVSTNNYNSGNSHYNNAPYGRNYYGRGGNYNEYYQ